MQYGGQSSIAPLRRALLVRPGWEPGPGERWWDSWGYEWEPDLEAARREHNQLAQVLTDWGVDIVYLEGDTSGLCDAVFAYDQALITDEGAIILRSGKASREGESQLMEQNLGRLGIRILHRMEPPTTADGGDFLWLRDDLLLVGRSYRTNAGRDPEFLQLMNSLGVKIVSCPVPHWTGPAEVMHLASFISLVDEDLAVVHRRIMAVETAELLQEHGIQFIDVSDEEFDSGLGANVLAVAPRRCLMLADYPRVRRELEEAGAEVRTFRAPQLSHCMKGGATCMTLPLLRDG
ncbi:MAG: arginine deiminase family protein [Bacillota bacterium]